ncbi:MAG: hypothetical protein ACSHW1_00805 [Yoonia sp.]|uniref:hypothetical protein n=1 Tax=Yoonia sp. TaxID=2212373 RepID=UPI003EF6C3EB
MGPVRRGLIAAIACLGPAPAWAAACDLVRPAWDGMPVGAVGELLFLLQSPMVLVMILGTALAVRFRSEWGGLVVVVGWSIVTYLITGWGDGDGTMAQAAAEGCVGSAWLFIAIAAALSIGVVLYTAPLPRGKKTNGDG